MQQLALVVLACVLALTGPTSAMAHEGHAHPEHEEAEPTGQVGDVEEGAAGAVAPQPDHDVAAHHGGAPAPLRNLHPAATHFPVGLLLTAALVELLAVWRGSTALASAGRTMAVAGGIGAAVAALLGWAHTGLWFGGDGAMVWHRWIGTALGVTGPLVAWLAWKRPGTAYRASLAIIAVVLVYQGWLGGELSQGAGHLWK